MEILKLKPVFKQYIWGGNNIKKIYKKDIRKSRCFFGGY